MKASVDQSIWEQRWATLARETREQLIKQVPVWPNSGGVDLVNAERLTQAARAEAVKNRFIRELAPTKQNKQQIAPHQDARAFLARVQTAYRLQLMTCEAGDFKRHYYWGFPDTPQLTQQRLKILAQARMPLETNLRELLNDFVSTRHWPDWVLEYLGEPVATQLFARIEASKKPVLLQEVPALLPEQDAATVRAALRQLLDLLALFEDVDSKSYQLVVGILIPVRQARSHPLLRGKTPPLQVCDAPIQATPATGYLVDALRVVLQELLIEPARLRQDRGVYQKEFARMEQRLEPIAAALLPERLESLTKRVEEALGWAITLEFTRVESRDGGSYLGVSPTGQQWLNAGAAQQYLSVYEHLASRNKARHEYYDYRGSHDGYFLGVDVSMPKVNTKNGARIEFDLRDEERSKLRKSFQRACAVLPLDHWVTQESFLNHVAQGTATPFPLPLPPYKRLLFRHNERVPPLFEKHVEVTIEVLQLLLEQRLIPLGCVQSGLDAHNAIVLKRTPRLDAFFGDKVDPTALAEAGSTASRVIVQPDFSVLIIGPNSSAASDLSAFCERVVTGHHTPGTVQLKITRASVLRAALQGGFTGEQLLQRLQTHSSVPIPSNIQHELHEWTQSVRQVNHGVRLVLACPDAQTAHRLRSVLGMNAELLTDTVLAYNGAQIPGAIRKKLQSEGINLRAGPLTTTTKPAKKTRQSAKP